jgi:hypothetical protein
MSDDWDEKAEHDRDLEYESRQDYESWQRDEPEPDPEREHKERMVKYGKRYQELLQAAVCEHKYAEQTCAPLGVRCIKCGQFIGAHE